MVISLLQCFPNVWSMHIGIGILKLLWGELDRMILSSFGKLKTNGDTSKLCVRVVKDDVGEEKIFLSPLGVPD